MRWKTVQHDRTRTEQVRRRVDREEKSRWHSGGALHPRRLGIASSMGGTQSPIGGAQMTPITWIGQRVTHLSGWSGVVVAIRQGLLAVKTPEGAIRVAKVQSVRVQK